VKRRGSPSCLDTRRAIPTATGAAGGHPASAVLVHDIEAKKSRNKEENSSKECKCNIRLELVTVSMPSDAVPVPDASAIRTNIIGEKTKSDHEACEEKEVHGPMKEGGGEGEEKE